LNESIEHHIVIEQPGNAVVDELIELTESRRHDRSARCERLEHLEWREIEGLLSRVRRDRKIHRSKVRRYLLMADLACQQHVLLEGITPDPLADVLQTRALADNQQPLIALPPSQLDHGIQKEVHPVPGLQASQETDDRLLPERIARSNRLRIYVRMESSRINPVGQAGDAIGCDSLRLQVLLQRF